MISLDIFDLELKQDIKGEEKKFDIEVDLLIPFFKDELFKNFISADLIEYAADIGNDLDFMKLSKFAEKVRKNPRKFLHDEEEQREAGEKIQANKEKPSLKEVKHEEKIEQIIDFRNTFGGDNPLNPTIEEFKGTATFGESNILTKKSGVMEEEIHPKKIIEISESQNNTERSSEKKMSEMEKIQRYGRAQYFYNKFIKPGFKKSKEIKEKRRIFKIQRPKKNIRGRDDSKNRTQVFLRPPTATNPISNSSGFSFPRTKRSLSLGPNLARKYIIKPKKDQVTLKDTSHENVIDLANYKLKTEFLKEVDHSKDDSYSKSNIANRSIHSNSNFRSQKKKKRISTLLKSPQLFDDSVENTRNLEDSSKLNSNEKDVSFDGFNHGFSLEDWNNDIVAKATPKVRKTRKRRGTITMN